MYEVPARVLEAFPNGVCVAIEGGCAFCAECDSRLFVVGGNGEPPRLSTYEECGGYGLPVVWYCKEA